MTGNIITLQALNHLRNAIIIVIIFVRHGLVPSVHVHIFNCSSYGSCALTQKTFLSEAVMSLGSELLLSLEIRIQKRTNTKRPPIVVRAYLYLCDKK